MPKISVIIPAHNVELYVGETLASVHAQTADDYEVIVIDDGSTDATAEVVKLWQSRFEASSGRSLTLVRRERGGSGAARNDALDRAQGDFLCFVDSDDLLHPEALEKLVVFLETDFSLDLVFPFCRHVDRDGRPSGAVSTSKRTRYSARDLLFANPIHSGTGVTIRRNRANAAGRFDTSLPACIDVDYWIRVTAHRTNNIAALPQVLVEYRLRPGQITGDWRRMRRGREMVTARAEQAGLGLSGKARDAALARNALVWSTAAYKHGDMASARRLALEFWRHDIGFALTDSHARIRTAACLTSLLPRPVHDWIRAKFNGLQ